MGSRNRASGPARPHPLGGDGHRRHAFVHAARLGLFLAHAALTAAAQETAPASMSAGELLDRVQRASRALARGGAAAERAVPALVECVEIARVRCREQDPPDPKTVACLSNSLYELARHPTGRAQLGDRARPWLEEALAIARRLTEPRHRSYVVGQMALSLGD